MKLSDQGALLLALFAVLVALVVIVLAAGFVPASKLGLGTLASTALVGLIAFVRGRAQ